MRITQKRVNQITYEIVGCAIEVHKQLGPGLLESIYEKCLIEELTHRGFEVTSQISVPITYKGKILEHDLKLDLLIQDLIIIELKAVEKMLPIFEAQLLSYLKLANKPKGLLINFNCKNIVDNMVPLVTQQFANLDCE